MTRVVHCKKESFTHYIGRPRYPETNLWQNEYTHQPGTRAKYLVKDRTEAVWRFAADIPSRFDIIQNLHTIKDGILGCWCHPQSCHGHVLAVLADEPGLLSFPQSWNRFIEELKLGRLAADAFAIARNV